MHLKQPANNISSLPGVPLAIFWYPCEMRGEFSISVILGIWESICLL
ncbi:hypothetical protein DCAR_0728239 [Daucus carota subsp. sativus]|uniref:Uncharacterized protein n=1 Tax=Daucus carota subsp. sativus TaxID=79200 RepID=A0AAF0XLS3_DAUCS|nr:hypothetical protein DCAR_0728239 [Daucus carota subsp. sativus]